MKQVQMSKRATCKRCHCAIDAGERAWMDWGTVTRHKSYSGRAIQASVPQYRHIECRQRFAEQMAEFDADTEREIANVVELMGLSAGEATIDALVARIRADRAEKREKHAQMLSGVYEIHITAESRG